MCRLYCYKSEEIFFVPSYLINQSPKFFSLVAHELNIGLKFVCPCLKEILLKVTFLAATAEKGAHMFVRTCEHA